MRIPRSMREKVTKKIPAIHLRPRGRERALCGRTDGTMKQSGKITCRQCIRFRDLRAMRAK